MKLFRLVVLLLAVSAPALTQAGPKPASCKHSFGFMYADKLGNKYESVQGKHNRRSKSPSCREERDKDGAPGRMVWLEARS